MADKDNKVVALSGKWGTGKSYMWSELSLSSSDEKIKSPLYASLFGLSTIDQVKMKLVQSSIPAVKANPRLWKGAQQAAKSGVKILEGFNKGFSALNDFGLVLAPAVLSDKFIVLDDIERKHEKLHIDEVLGFIDEFTQQHDCRFLLILNSDRLDKRDVWNALREKVIDQELHLNTSSEEAFEIASTLSPSAFSDLMRKSVVVCGIVNIRIIGRVIKVVNRILADREDLSDAVLGRVIPSTVLLAAIHYKGIDNAPDFDYVVSYGAATHWADGAKEGEQTEEDKRRAKWSALMSELGIYGCDEYELLTVEFLQSGLVDITKVSDIIDRYVAEADVAQAQEETRRFLDRYYWEHTLTEQEILDEAKRLVDKTHLLDAYTFTLLYDCIAELSGGQPVADAALDKWLDNLKAKNLSEVNSENLFQRKLNARISRAFCDINEKAQKNTTVHDACVYIVEHSGWGTRQELALRAATIEDMELILRHSPVPEMRRVVIKMLDLHSHGGYEEHFGSAVKNFIAACRNIAQDTQAGRLPALIRRLFADSKISNLLE
ncbi:MULTISPECIES: NTPase KAP [unclassified Caballeronia]|uniref:NTPase KAP n=1 Tax=unclassified Caballeronia TaxID=2646786 RepID=UPI002859B3EE|nr:MULTISPECIES: NTPase KAP [unclassified Caballeronia]MDR5771010.1 NTPase KAP [Caballeronia sp. LZ002]MDR5846447.1 NTPase KAP [Caballeronia sp. LZ003]